MSTAARLLQRHHIAAYSTWMAFEPPDMQLLTGYWRAGDAAYVELIRDGLFARPAVLARLAM